MAGSALESCTGMSEHALLVCKKISISIAVTCKSSNLLYFMDGEKNGSFVARNRNTLAAYIGIGMGEFQKQLVTHCRNHSKHRG